MAMTEEEILSEAGRIRASKRRRVAKTCERCGKQFEAIARAKYCSDACRVAAAREHAAAREQSANQAHGQEFKLPGESWRDYYIRKWGEPTPEAEEAIAAVERIEAIWGGKKPVGDSTEMIRRMREERSEYLSKR
jgi:hypothetical protein